MWRLLAQRSFDSSSVLHAGGQWRSCASRAYYAVFALITQQLIQLGQQPRQQFGTWSHERLPDMVRIHLKPGSEASAGNLSYAVWRLYRLRIAADYIPNREFGKREAFESMGLMAQIFRTLRQEADR